MKDYILHYMFSHNELWQRAVERGFEKGMSRADLRDLCSEQTRAKIYQAIRDRVYVIAPPHVALIPKDNGDHREVMANEPIDRLVLHVVCELLFELCGDMVHPTCRSYQKNMSCGNTVQDLSRTIQYTKPDENGDIGWKADLSKYFDSVPKPYIDAAFDRVESRYGKSAVIDMIRRYYNTDWLFDANGNLVEVYKSLKQGCAVAAWLADVILFDMDAELHSLNGEYRRYCDDTIFIGPDHAFAKRLMATRLKAMQMELNPKKVEQIKPNRWVQFLGFSIKGRSISLSENAIDRFQKDIDEATAPGKTYDQALTGIYKALYTGYGDFSWGTRVLRVINVPQDIDMLNKYMMDRLRAVLTQRFDTGGLGWCNDMKDGCIGRGTGSNVRSNRDRTDEYLNGYKTLRCLQNALRSGRSVYDTMVRTILKV